MLRIQPNQSLLGILGVLKTDLGVRALQWPKFIDVIYEKSLILHSVVLFSKSANSYNKEQDIIEHYWKGISEKD